MTNPSLEFLKSSNLFSDVSDRGLRGISETMTRRSFAAGDSMLEEGQGGIGFFLIESGTVVVSKQGSEFVQLGPGDHVGEVALLAGSARTATITASTDVVCWGMTQWVFRPMLKDQPTVALKLLEELARQLAR